MEQLRAISVASPGGRLKNNAMVLKAVEEYIAARISSPEVQQALASIRGQPIRLVKDRTKAEPGSEL
jgi:hypothetical protein